jgi:hypothetical protein
VFVREEFILALAGVQCEFAVVSCGVSRDWASAEGVMNSEKDKAEEEEDCMHTRFRWLGVVVFSIFGDALHASTARSPSARST